MLTFFGLFWFSVYLSFSCFVYTFVTFSLSYVCDRRRRSVPNAVPFFSSSISSDSSFGSTGEGSNHYQVNKTKTGEGWNHYLNHTGEESNHYQSYKRKILSNDPIYFVDLSIGNWTTNYDQLISQSLKMILRILFHSEKVNLSLNKNILTVMIILIMFKIWIFREVDWSVTLPNHVQLNFLKAFESLSSFPDVVLHLRLQPIIRWTSSSRKNTESIGCRSPTFDVSWSTTFDGDVSSRLLRSSVVVGRDCFWNVWNVVSINNVVNDVKEIERWRNGWRRRRNSRR